MPPIIQRQKTIPGRAAAVKAPAGLGQDVGAAVGEFGRAIGDVGGVIMQRRERLRLQDLKNKSSDIETTYDDEQRAWSAGETSKTGGESFGNIERAEKFRDDSILKHTKDIEDPTLKSQIKGYIQNRSGGMMDKLSIHQANQRSEVSGQIRERKIDGVLKDSFDGNEPIEESIFRWQETIVGQRETGQLGEEEAAELLVNGEEKIAEASLDGIVNRDPEAAIELIEAGAYDEFLDQKQIKAFDKQAKTLQKALDADAKAMEIEKERLGKVAKEEQRQEANKGLVDMSMTGTLTKTAIEEKRDRLSAADYDKWSQRLSKSLENKKKATGKIVENVEKKRDLEVEAMKMGPETTEIEAEELRLKVAEAIEKEEMEPETGRKIITDSVNSRKVGDVRKAQETGIMKLIAIDFEEGGTMRELGLDSRDKLDIEAFVLKSSRENPDKPVAEIYDEILKPIKTEKINQFLTFFSPEPVIIAREDVDPIRRAKAIEALEEGGFVVNEETISKIAGQFDAESE